MSDEREDEVTLEEGEIGREEHEDGIRITGRRYGSHALRTSFLSSRKRNARASRRIGPTPRLRGGFKRGAASASRGSRTSGRSLPGPAPVTVQSPSPQLALFGPQDTDLRRDMVGTQSSASLFFEQPYGDDFRPEAKQRKPFRNQPQPHRVEAFRDVPSSGGGEGGGNQANCFEQYSTPSEHFPINPPNPAYFPMEARGPPGIYPPLPPHYPPTHALFSGYRSETKRTRAAPSDHLARNMSPPFGYSSEEMNPVSVEGQQFNKVVIPFLEEEERMYSSPNQGRSNQMQQHCQRFETPREVASPATSQTRALLPPRQPLLPSQSRGPRPVLLPTPVIAPVPVTCFNSFPKPFDAPPEAAHFENNAYGSLISEFNDNDTDNDMDIADEDEDIIVAPANFEPNEGQILNEKLILDAEEMKQVLNSDAPVSPYDERLFDNLPHEVDVPLITLDFSDDDDKDRQRRDATPEYELWLEEALDKSKVTDRRGQSARGSRDMRRSKESPAPPRPDSSQRRRHGSSAKVSYSRTSRNSYRDDDDRTGSSHSRGSVTRRRFFEHNEPKEQLKKSKNEKQNKNIQNQTKRVTPAQSRSPRKQVQTLSSKHRPGCPKDHTHRYQGGRRAAKRASKKRVVTTRVFMDESLLERPSVDSPMVGAGPSSPEEAGDKKLEEASFEELMNYYKNIQNQLIELTQEEELRALSKEEIALHVADGESSQEAPSGLNQGPAITPEEEEDLLELRRLALQSKKGKLSESEVREEQQDQDSLQNGSDTRDEPEVDEDSLRAQLLLSLQAKKKPQVTKKLKQKQNQKQLEEPIASKSYQETKVDETSSPISEEVIAIVTSSQPLNVNDKQPEKVPPKPENKAAPAQPVVISKPTPVPPNKKIIIHFGDDSSEDEATAKEKSAAKSNLPPLWEFDLFLKQARQRSDDQGKANAQKQMQSQPTKNIDPVNKLSNAMQVEYRKLKEEIAKREKSVSGKTSLLKTETKWRQLKANLQQKRSKMIDLKAKAAQKRAQFKKAQQQARKMHELYLAATKVVTTSAGELNALTNDVKCLQEEVAAEETETASVEEECLRLGLQLDGNTYTLPSVATLKRTVENVESPRKRLRNSESDNKLKSNQELAEEKRRLQELERIVSERLDLLNTSRPSAPRPGENVNEKDEKQKEEEGEKQRIRSEKLGVLLKRNVDRLLKKTSHIYTPLSHLLNMMTCPPSLTPLGSSIQVPVQCSEETLSEEPVKSGSHMVTSINSNSYRSVLRHLHSYRLTPNYELHAKNGGQKCEVTCTSYANLIDPKQYLCRFDLIGTCNDEQCIWQHKENYFLTSSDKLADLLSYQPSVAGLTENQPENFRPKLRLFAKRLIDKYPHLTTEQLSLKLVKAIRTSRKDSNSCCQLTRAVPRFEPKAADTFQDYRYEIKYKDRSLVLSYGKIFQLKATSDPDAHIKNRFFAPEGRPISAELETTLASNINDIQLWLKLAYYHVTRTPTRKGECVNRALNVLSRALEHNKMDCELWEHFLYLYSNQKEGETDDKHDVLNVCRKAVAVCPYYRVWKFYLSLCTTFKDKDEVSTQLIESIAGGKLADDQGKDLSHCLLEILLYKTRLLLQANQREKAKQFLTNALVRDELEAGREPQDAMDVIEWALESTAGDPDKACRSSDGQLFLGSKLSPCDRVFAWLCCFSLVFANSLPNDCMDLFRQGFSQVLNKKPFLVPLTRTPKEPEYKKILAFFELAFHNCFVCLDPSNFPNRVELCLPLFANLAQFELRYNRKSMQPAVDIYKRLFEVCNSSSLYVLLAETQAASGQLSASLETIRASPAYSDSDSSFIYFASVLHFELQDYSSFRQELQKLVKHFVGDVNNSSLGDAFHSIVAEVDPLKVTLNRNIEYKYPVKSVKLWLCYIWLQIEEGKSVKYVVSCFESALNMCKLGGESESEMQLIWWMYLRYVSQQTKTQHQFNELLSLIRHCCLSIDDNLFQIKIIRYFSNLLEEDKDRLLLLTEFVKLIPENSSLVQQTLTMGLKLKETKKCLDLLDLLVSRKKHRYFNEDIWKIFVALALDREDHYKAHCIFHLALSHFPYNVTLWKLMQYYEESVIHQVHAKEARLLREKLLIPILEAKTGPPPMTFPAL